MTCIKCGADLRSEDLFCPKCGAEIDEGNKAIQEQLDEAIDYGFFEDEEAEAEREESQRIVDGFFKENKKHEQVQKVLDQACDALRMQIATGEFDMEDEVSEEPVREIDGDEKDLEELAESLEELAEAIEGESREESAEKADLTADVAIEEIEKELIEAGKEIEEAKETVEGVSKKAKAWMAVLIVLMVLAILFLILVLFGRDTALGQQLFKYIESGLASPLGTITTALDKALCRG